MSAFNRDNDNDLVIDDRNSIAFESKLLQHDKGDINRCETITRVLSPLPDMAGTHSAISRYCFRGAETQQGPP